MSRLLYNAPANEWEEALPLGNGRLGAMVYGGITHEVIQVNEESMWLGGPVNRNNPDAKKYLDEIRQLLLDGKISQAEKLMSLSLSGCPESMHAYQTLGEIHFNFDGIEPDTTTEYVRSLSLDDAVANVKYKNDTTVITRETFASKPADMIIMRFEAEGEKKLNFTANLRRGRWFDGVKTVQNNTICLYGNLGRGGFEYSCALKAKTFDGKVETIGENIVVSDATDVCLYFTADTTYHYPELEIDNNDIKNESWSDYELKLQGKLQDFLLTKILERFEKVENTDYELLKKEHIKDHQELYKRVELKLNDDDEFEHIPTDIRLSNIKAGKKDIGLSKLLFDFGRYLSIACSRKGGLPATLQGLWNKDFFPAWESKYTININTEMNYWHVESCNLSECHEPLFELIYKMVKNGRVTAKEMYGCRGFVAHHNTDIHGDTAPQDIWIPGTYWTLGAAWLCTHLWMHYRYTLDKEFLKKAFPVMLEAALFFVDFLTKKDGFYVTNPSVSPENTYILPSGEKGACCVGATMDNQILRDLFSGCLKAYEILQNESFEEIKIEGITNVDSLINDIRVRFENLMPDRISESGRIMEWMEDYEELEPGHRHISHLYGLYPAEQITPDLTPELAKAASKTLEYRLSHGGGHTGWSRAWIMNHYASLWDGEKVYENLNAMLSQSTYPNMFDRHPPFQIDGNFGACAAITRMMVQSSNGRVVLLPAIPRDWKDGSIKGIRLEGNAEIEIKWCDGKLVSAVIEAFDDYHTTVIYQDKKYEVFIPKNQKIDVAVQ